jgi:NADH-quinone oxidoreductase subunit N
VLAFVFAIFLFAQAGVPLTSGFFAKFYVLKAAIDANSWPLALTAMLSAVIAAFLYLRITVSMYMTDEGAEPADEVATPPSRRLPVPFGAGLALAVSFAVTLYVGFLPSSLADTSHDAVPTVTAPPK